MASDSNTYSMLAGLRPSRSRRAASDSNQLPPPSVASLSPAGSELTGGGSSVERGSVQGKKRFSTFYVARSEALCCGAVRSQGAVRGCIKHRGDCEIAGHKSNKIDLQNGCYYLQINRTFVGLDVMIPVADISESDREQLQDGSYSVEEFTVLRDNLQMTERLSSWEDIDVEGTSAHVARAAEFMTPAKKKARHMISSPADQVQLPTMNSPWKTDTKEDRGAAVSLILQAWPALYASVRELSQWTKDLPSEIEDALSINGDTSAEAILEVSTQVRLVQAAIGERVFDKFSEATNVWEGLEYLKGELHKVLSFVETFEQHHHLDLPKRMTTTEAGFKELIAWCKSEQAFNSTQFAAQDSDLTKLRTRINALEEGAGKGRPGPPGCDEMSIEVLSTTDEPHNPHEGPNLEDLMQRVERLERRGKDNAATVGRVEFQSEGDVLKYLTTHKVTGNTGIFWDLTTLLICMGMSLGSTGKDRSDSAYSAHRAGEMSGLEANYLASFGHRRPNLFFGKDDLKGEDAVLAIASSFDGWSDGGEYSVEHKVSVKLEKFIKSVRQTIDRQPISIEAKDLGSKMLDEALSQWDVLKEFMSRMHKELVTLANFRPEAAWRLMGKALGGVFQYIDEDRSQSSLIETTRHLSDRASVTWSALRSHQKMKEFVAVRFKTHPIIVKELSLFMLTERVDPTGITALQTALKRSRDEAAHSLEVAAAADAKARGAMESLKVLENSYKKLSNEWSQFRLNQKRDKDKDKK